MKILGIIPARYGSTRFPGKVLADIGGKTMVRRVYEQAVQSSSLTNVVIATDDERVAKEVYSFGGKAVMTASHHPSGTDRCMEVLTKESEEYDFVINIQGDEPFIQPSQIDTLAQCLQPETELATLIKKIDDHTVLTNPGEVKVVCNSKMEALYFSRHPIPYLRGIPVSEWLFHHTYYDHVGLYAYRTDILKAITALQPSPLENAESLEQLRWLENGYQIKVQLTTEGSLCIETPEDLEAILKIYF